MAEKRIKNFINETLTGEVQKKAMDFAEFLRANDMTFGEEHGVIKYKDENVCYCHFDGGSEYPSPWTVWSEGDYDKEHPELLLEERQKEFIWENAINSCGNCGSGCQPGSTKTIFGKEFENVCGAVLNFYIYGGETDSDCLECMKKIIEIRKRNIDNRV